MIKGTHFSSLEEIRAAVKELKSLNRRSLLSASVDFRIECRRALTQRESTLKGTICNLPKNVALKFITTVMFLFCQTS